MKTFLTAAILTSLALAAGPMGFEDFDADNDGKVTAEEFSAQQAKNMQERAQSGAPMRNAGNAPGFGQMDQNGDGIMTREEFNAHRANRMRQRTVPAQRKGMGQSRGQGMGMGRN